jgi:hypothetical protein
MVSGVMAAFFSLFNLRLISLSGLRLGLLLRIFMIGYNLVDSN